MMAVNPCTALRMLSEFVELSPGETVVQNGSTSAVGHAVVAIAKAWGLRSVNIIRDRRALKRSAAAAARSSAPAAALFGRQTAASPPANPAGRTPPQSPAASWTQGRTLC